MLSLTEKSRGRLALLPVLGVVFALSACGGGGSKSGAGTGGVAGASHSHGGGQQVVVTETEFKLQLSTTSLKAGPTTFVAMNKGHVAHSLEINGPGVSSMRIPGTIQPGSSKSFTVTLQQGSYDLFCPVDSHKHLGMDIQLQVGGGSTGGMGTSGGSSGSSGSGGGY